MTDIAVRWSAREKKIMSSIQYQRKELEKVYLLNLKDSSLEKLKNDSDQMKIRYLQRKIRSQNEIFDINWTMVAPSPCIQTRRGDVCCTVEYSIFVTTIIIITQLSVHAQVNVTGVLKIVTIVTAHRSGQARIRLTQPHIQLVAVGQSKPCQRIMDDMDGMVTIEPVDMEQEETAVIAKEFDTSFLDTSFVTSLGPQLRNLGEIGQIGIVWFSMGVAIWQLIMIGRTLLAAGESNN